jgi:ribonuclease H2 subunit A
MDDSQPSDSQIALETPPSPSTIFIPPSINSPALLAGDSYTYFSAIPPAIENVPVCLGVDEAGRGPVLGPMVYGVYFLPLPLSDSLLRHPSHRFDDSKVLTPAFRSQLMQTLSTPTSDLFANSGWAISSLSARDIGAHMFSPSSYNLNAQAMDATVELIKGVIERGVAVAEIYVDTVGPPATYQKKLEQIFPMAKVTVAKKADSLYPCVSAASVCAKVTRDAALEVLYRDRAGVDTARDAKMEGAEEMEAEEEESMAWGSGYPSDGRCVAWMRSNMHPVFGWGPECRFSWGTAKDMLEPAKSTPGTVKVEWPIDEDGDNARVTDFFVAGRSGEEPVDELGTWFGTPASLEAF